VIPAVYT